ncbi:MAG: 4-hydroxythreonine-4-phosphate dehydrogenase PdxA [Deltaproteobacteria bacterium]|nr:4-hydroxythreonine-4-phosphate dehydrogenase PdxA [Deltaproteobacteria bacterium]
MGICQHVKKSLISSNQVIYFLFKEKRLKERPFIGITMGDPSGIGPEIIIKALSDPGLYDLCKPLVIGDPGAFTDPLINPTMLPINAITKSTDAEGSSRSIDLIAVSRLQEAAFRPGHPSPETGRSMVKSIITAVRMAMDKEIAAMVTGPIRKDLMHQAGYHYEGHTQFIAHLTDTDDYVMLLAGDRLRVALVTIHCALKDVSGLLSRENVLKTIRITAGSLRQDFRIGVPRLAVSALNPHASEAGLFGDEEEMIITPAIEEAKKQGLNVEGPFPADTLFYKAASGQFDAVVAMYHDQGLIPLKLLHFSDAVNTTLGLPIIRTSVDHGTAYDIAGRGIADPSSLKAAIRMAVRMAKNRGID